jgi:hypothetical protein
VPPAIRSYDLEVIGMVVGSLVWPEPFEGDFKLERLSSNCVMIVFPSQSSDPARTE